MAGSPEWKVYDASGIYQAACKELEAAACLVALYGGGSTIRSSHTLIVWREGQEAFPAHESYDGVANVALDRRYAARRAGLVKQYGEQRVKQWETEKETAAS